MIMLSEGTDGNLVKPYLDRLSGFGWQMSINFFMKNNVATGIITGTRARPTRVAWRRTRDLEPWVKSPKTLLITKYAVADHGRILGEILFVDIHGINWAGNAAFARHLKLAEPFIAAHHGPVLFAGDFNVKNKTRFEMLKAFGRKYGLRRMPWKNPESAGEQRDDALYRGFHVESAALDMNVIKHGSDHPALLMRLTPVWH